MRKHIAFTLVAATLALVGCGSSQDSESKTGSDSLATGQPTSSIDLSVTTTTASSTAGTSTIPTTAPVQTVAPQSTTPAVTVAPKAPTATTAPKAPVATQVPQMQLTGTPQEQANQVLAATAKVAAYPLSSPQWNQSFVRLNDSLVSYGIRVRWDPNETGRNIYQISMDGQSACFLWAYADNTSDSRSLQPHSCS